MSKCPVSRSGGWCGRCYEGLRGRRHYQGHAGVPSGSRKVRYGWMSLKRPVVSGGGSGADGGASSSCALTEMYPTVAEFLSRVTWEGGDSRDTGTITLLWEGGLWKAALNDRDEQVSCFVSARTLTALFRAMEAGLEEGSLEWRAKKPFRAGRSGKGG